MTDPTWSGDGPPDAYRIGALGWVLVVSRALVVSVVVYGGLGLLLLLRLVERPLHGPVRPWTPWITQGVCRASLWLMGISYETRGRPDPDAHAIVSNHVSWLDIFSLNSAARIYFVSKDEVRGWPGIGWLARATGTVFIRRNPRDAKAQRDMLEDRLSVGHPLLFFPEGTSTDGLRVLPFKPTLFAAFFSERLHGRLSIQPVTVAYHAPPGEDARFYGWWGDMDFAPHLLKTLASPRQGKVEVIWHTSLRVADFADRKSLARAAEAAVRKGLDDSMVGSRT